MSSIWDDIHWDEKTIKQAIQDNETEITLQFKQPVFFTINGENQHTDKKGNYTISLTDDFVRSTLGYDDGDYIVAEVWQTAFDYILKNHRIPDISEVASVTGIGIDKLRELSLHKIIMSEDYKQFGISPDTYELYDEFESGKNIELEKLAKFYVYTDYFLSIYNGHTTAPVYAAKKK